ncbi:MAG: DEAD/DEAH box helicase [Lewinellaceae bacterium]|nr:DEAD/DEAH box helicase [Saprospiraceae bacterium]MCB9340264.1 DEAD/DEAH box helicase [Lewinellaceae bacterium]
MVINTFRQRFKDLHPVEKEMLKILSVAYEPCNQNEMVNLLRECDIRNDKGTHIQAPQVKEYRELLDAGGWLQFRDQEEMQVAEKYRELVMRMAVIDPQFKTFVRAVTKLFPYREWNLGPRNFDVCIRDLRIALYEGNLSRSQEVILDILRFFKEEWAQTEFFFQFFHPFDPDWLATFPPDIQALALLQMIGEAMSKLEPVDELLDFVKNNGWLDNKKTSDTGISLLILPLVQMGRFAEAEALVDKLPTSFSKLLNRGMVEFFTKRNNEALHSFDEGLKLFKKEAVLKKGVYPGFEGVVHLLALLKDKGKDFLKKTLDLLVDTPESIHDGLLVYLQSALLHQLNYLTDAREMLGERPEEALEWIFFAAAHYWNDQPLPLRDVDELKTFFHKANKYGYRWMALEFANLIAKFDPDEKTAGEYEEAANKLEAALGTESILHLIQRTEKWERSLEALMQLQGKKGKKGKAAEKLTRLVWWVDFKKNQVQPVEQTFGKGGWSKGRNVALKRLKEFKISNLTDQDMEAARAIKAYNQGYYGGMEYEFDWEKLLPALVGHPLLFLMENPAVSVELLEKKPQLLVEESKNGYEMRFSYEFKSSGLFLVRETPTRYILLMVNEVHAEINRLLEYGRLQLPARAKDKVIEAVGNLSTIVTVQSEVGGEAMDIPTVEGDATIFIHLLPVGDGFKIEFFVKPFTSEPPYFKPGAGRENIIAEVNGLPSRATRDLKKEKENARSVEDACPTLLKIPNENREWLFDDVEDCLNVLLELEPLKQGGDIVMEYPKGEKLRIAGQVGFDQLSMGIQKERDWFSVDGKVQVNENLVMDFRKLLDLSQNSKSNFVEISDGQFLALTGQLKRRLEELNSLFSKTKNDLRFHPLAIHAMEDFTNLLDDVQVDAAWKKQLARLKESRDIKPNVPSTFKAELRPYQEDGFRWLSQMAHWGVGACLADDMGLGKTVQALALLLDRAKQGPAMVCAPASVVRNWYHEARKFTPTLNPLVFGEADRKETLDNLQPFDLLLVSYGLLQQESDLLTETHFNTVVLDEAQAIKNRATKRSQAAMQLQADFKIITTGTPIENHLGELWNLFNFLNPGLLGSLDRFNETYAVPIERYQDRDRRNQLRKLIQPFILRRRKNDVLDELPEKTEITLSVELSQEERAFYEALRRQAVANIENAAGEASDKRFKILAELMKLRQAACHPKMVKPDSDLPSSKLNLFAETVEELRSEGHKALVFSQFVKHLKIIEEWVQQQGIPYQYLDGSTPMGQRDKAIRAFQAGEGDLFLISLKAGGFGLNLTAADYVLHLDPWWNPAVEDQASDRAHRIGQTRPVTIYRLVVENTIEEKIVKLHGDKRELADSLLEGTEMSGKLSADELLELIKS